MSYQTQLISPTSNHKRTSQGPHRLSGSSRWRKPVLKPNTLFTVTTHIYIDVITSLKTQKPNSDPYKLSKTTTPNPQYYDPEYGKDPYWDDDIYDKHNLQFRNDDYPPTDDEDDPDIVNNILSRALIEPWQPNFDAIKDQPHAEETQATPGLLDETAFIHVLVTKEGEPAYIHLSTNLGLKYKKRMLYFPMDFGELTIDGLIDTGAHSSAIPEADLRKIRLLAPQSIIKEGPAPTFQIMVANGQLETPKSTVELKFEVGDIEFHEIFIVMEKLTGPIIGLMFLQRNHTVLDMRQGILNFPYFSMQLKTADHKYSNVLEPILNPDDITIPLNDSTLVEIKSQI